MNHIKTFSIFESTQELTQEQKNFLNKYARGRWVINSEGEIDVNGSFNCSRSDIQDLMRIKFGKVTRTFDCSDNKMISLEGCPREVGEHFMCYSNRIVTLEGCPEKVGGGFYCYQNELTSLEGAPEVVPGEFDCRNNNLKNLIGSPKEVDRDFVCYNNDLDSFVGAPDKIGGSFISEKMRTSKWSFENLVKDYLDPRTHPVSKKIIGTLVSPEVLQKEIDANPEKMAIKIKSIVHLPEYKNLNWPKDLRSEVDLLSDLNGIGL